MSCLSNIAVADYTEAPQAGISVETISNYRAFLDLKPTWDRLVEAAGIDHPFLEHDWIRTWWDSFSKGSSLYILLVKSGDEPIAIAPMIRSTVRMWGMKVRRLGFFYNAHVPRADFIIAQQPHEAYRVIWDHLYQNRSWDILQFCQLPHDSATLEELPRLAAENDCPTGAWLSAVSPYQPIRTSWGQYFNGLSAKHRANLRNRFKRLRKMGSVEMESITSDENLADALEAGMRLEAAGWKGKANTAIACDPNISRFYSTLAWRAAERGWIHLNFLNAGPNRVAFDYSLSYKNKIYRLKSGYDPALAYCSPSHLLVFLAMQDAFERHLTEYDFLGASDEWKRKWAEETRAHYWLYVFAPTVKGRLLHRIKFHLVPTVKRGLRKLYRAISQLTARSPIVALQDLR
jgi:CelD/BcsL family acetyltransferase involved in cellulose biosynthesis